MKLRYIKHSSYAIFNENFNMLFDYYKGEMPDFEKDKVLFIFVSHRHYDHFSKEIFSLEKKVDKIIYIVSDDIDRRDVPENILDKLIFLSPNTDKEISLENEKIRIHTYKSTDEGLAFIIDTKDKRIYYAGDLNYWYWEEESTIWNESQEKDYKSQLKYMQALLEDGKNIDMAFIPLDNRQGEFAYLGIEYFIDFVDAKKIFPMHFNGAFDIIEKLKDRLKDEDKNKIVRIEKENEEFIL